MKPQRPSSILFRIKWKQQQNERGVYARGKAKRKKIIKLLVKKRDRKMFIETNIFLAAWHTCVDNENKRIYKFMIAFGAFFSIHTVEAHDIKKARNIKQCAAHKKSTWIIIKNGSFDSFITIICSFVYASMRDASRCLWQKPSLLIHQYIMMNYLLQIDHEETSRECLARLLKLSHLLELNVLDESQ